MAASRFPDAPARIARLPADPRGFPVPWFVSWRDGVPQFPVIDAAKLGAAWRDERCWVCGERLGAWRGWVVGPMSVIEGATPEPPSHCDCAAFAVKSCPHLTSAQTRPGATAGYARQANVSHTRSSATAIWITKGRGATPFQANGGLLFKLEEPSRLDWYAERRSATAAEVRSAITVGLPILRQAAEAERRVQAFEARLRWLERWTPAERPSSAEGRD